MNYSTAISLVNSGCINDQFNITVKTGISVHSQKLISLGICFLFDKHFMKNNKKLGIYCNPCDNSGETDTEGEDDDDDEEGEDNHKTKSKNKKLHYMLVENELYEFTYNEMKMYVFKEIY